VHYSTCKSRSDPRNLCPSRTTETPFAPEDVDFLSRASGQIAIAIENALAYHEISELKDKLAQEKLYLEEEIRSDSGFERIIGKSAPLKHILELVDTVAPSDSTVLLLGEPERARSSLRAQFTTAADVKTVPL